MSTMFGKRVDGVVEPYFDNLSEEIKEDITNGVYKELRLINNAIDRDEDLVINEKVFKDSVKKHYDILVNFKKTHQRDATVYEDSAHFITTFMEKKPLGFTKKLKYRSNEILPTLLALQKMNRKNRLYKSLPRDFFNNLVMLFINMVERKEKGCLECIILLLQAVYLDRKKD